MEKLSAYTAVQQKNTKEEMSSQFAMLKKTCIVNATTRQKKIIKQRSVHDDDDLVSSCGTVRCYLEILEGKIQVYFL